MTIHYNNRQNYNVEYYVLWCRGDEYHIINIKKKNLKKTQYLRKYIIN